MININILPVCDVIGRCPLKVVRGNLLTKKGQLSVLVVMGLSQIKTNCTQGIPGRVGGNLSPKMFGHCLITDGNQGSWALTLFNSDWLPSTATLVKRVS